MDNGPLYVCKYRNKQGRQCPLRPGIYCSYAIGQCSSVINPEHALKIFGIPIINKGETMMTMSKKKKKKESIFMRKSFLKVWTGKDGKAYSKARGSLSQNINNYNTMITYLREQANAMAGSATMMLGQAPDVIIGTMEKQPRILAGARSGGGSDYYSPGNPGGGGGSAGSNKGK